MKKRLTTVEKRIKARKLMAELEAKGFEALFGGNKGFGFWIKDAINPRNNRNWFLYSEAEQLVRG